MKDKAGNRALYYWIYPNFMINWYEGSMDTNLVVPRSVNTTDVIFDFYFAGGTDAASIAASEQIQDEDKAVCESVQRGLASRAYTPAACRPDAKRECTSSTACCMRIFRNCRRKKISRGLRGLHGLGTKK